MWILELIGGADKPQWKVFRHNGPMFPPKYVPHKIPVIINNKEVILPELAEEYATMLARYIGTPYMESHIFKKNFWKDFKPTLGNINASTLEEIDFSLIRKYLDVEKAKKQSMTKEEKERIKKEGEKIEEPYKYCVIDGAQQKVGNFKIEPPGIFIGRGTHPKLGHIKRRITPEDVIINLDKESTVPKPNVEGNWGEVIHDNKVIWLASWKEQITKKTKYIFTSLDSIFKSKSDEDKFDLARQLKKKANSIRQKYEEDLNDQDIKKKQLATALYFIDHLSLRVGGNKDTKEQADTVGVTSLRVEHISLIGDNTIKLDFLGKDSIRYFKKVTVTPDVYKNLDEFTKDKNKKEDLFDKISRSMLNEYQTEFLEGLTSKVWRTYNASFVFQKELDKIDEEKLKKIDAEERINFLISIFNQANTAVALLCNHQKKVSGNAEEQIKAIDDKIKELKKKKAKYVAKKNTEKANKVESKIKVYKLKKELKVKMKNVSLATSKNNYIDPRIIFSFIKKYEIPAEKLFHQHHIDRFKWASEVDKDFRF